MRTHTALHILCGVIWADYGIPVTGGNMEPLKGRLDFPFPAMSADLGAQVERRINDEIERAHEIVVDFLPRIVADTDPALIRTSANLIPAAIDPLRVIDIVGLDRQADGGTHVLSTAEVGRVRVTGTESKGKDNKRIRLEVVDPEAAGEPAAGGHPEHHGRRAHRDARRLVRPLAQGRGRRGPAAGDAAPGRRGRRDARGAADVRGLPRLLAAAHGHTDGRLPRPGAEVRRLLDAAAIPAGGGPPCCPAYPSTRYAG